MRASLTMEAGLHSAFAFPIVLGDETLGIMTFFSHENREPDEDLLQMMASIGSQMGQFAERKRTEDALRESEARLQLGMEAARFGCWEVEVTTGKQRDLQAWNVCWASRRGVWEPYGRPSSLSSTRKIARYRSGTWNAALRPSKAQILSTGLSVPTVRSAGWPAGAKPSAGRMVVFHE